MPAVVFGSVVLDTPVKKISAARVEEVLGVLEFAEREARAGSHVALMLSYEAAPAFDPVLAVHQPAGFPLAWAASFTHASDLPTEKVASVSSKSWTPKVVRDEYDKAV